MTYAQLVAERLQAVKEGFMANARRLINDSYKEFLRKSVPVDFGPLSNEAPKELGFGHVEKLLVVNAKSAVNQAEEESTGRVVYLDRFRLSGHSAGEAICRNCKHEWAAVAPIGERQFECPECGTWHGAFKYPFGPSVGDDSYACTCGCEDYFIMRKAGNVNGEVRCRQCGVEALGWFK